MTGSEIIPNVKRPFAIKTHLPAFLNPWSEHAKYIIVIRNPKDTLVSFFHHTRSLPGYRFKNGSLDTFFDLFITGRCDFGDYYTFLLSWWEKRSAKNVLLITYEEMKADTKGSITKIASFIGKEYEEKLSKDGTFLDNVIKYSSIEHMKCMNDGIKKLFDCPIEEMPMDKKCGHLMFSVYGRSQEKVEFVRKGIVNDAKMTLTVEQDAYLTKQFLQRTKGTGILDLWKDKSWL